MGLGMAMTSGVCMNGRPAGASVRPTSSFTMPAQPLAAGDQMTGCGPLFSGSGQPCSRSLAAAPEDLRVTRTETHWSPTLALDGVEGLGQVGEQRHLLGRHRHVDGRRSPGRSRAWCRRRGPCCQSATRCRPRQPSPAPSRPRPSGVPAWSSSLGHSLPEISQRNHHVGRGQSGSRRQLGRARRRRVPAARVEPGVEPRPRPDAPRAWSSPATTTWASGARLPFGELGRQILRPGLPPSGGSRPRSCRPRRCGAATA